MDQAEWSRRYVKRWWELSEGKHDPHATWDDAAAAFRKHRALDPEAVAEANFEQTAS
jgi:hypothetical protein